MAQFGNVRGMRPLILLCYSLLSLYYLFISNPLLADLFAHVGLSVLLFEVPSSLLTGKRYEPL